MLQQHPAAFRLRNSCPLNGSSVRQPRRVLSHLPQISVPKDIPSTVLVCKALWNDGKASGNGTSGNNPASVELLDEIRFGEDVQPADGMQSTSLSTTEEPAPPNATSQAASSIDAWHDYFQDVDARGELQKDLLVQLQDAVRREEYGQAAVLKKSLTALEEADAVAYLQRELKAALQQERYEDAARLRDHGMASLQGWWAGVGEDDVEGHLMHVAPEHGRWTGRVYRSRDIALLQGWREGPGAVVHYGPSRSTSLNPTGSSRGSGGSRSLGSRLLDHGEAGEGKTGSVGSPSMEVFVRMEADGQLSTQPVLLKPLLQFVQEQRQQRQEPYTKFQSFISGGGVRLHPDSVVRVSIAVGSDGTAAISATAAPPAPPAVASPSSSAPRPRSTFSPSEAQEAQAAMSQLADIPASHSIGSRDASSSSHNTTSSSIGAAQRMQSGPADIPVAGEQAMRPAPSSLQADAGARGDHSSSSSRPPHGIGGISSHASGHGLPPQGELQEPEYIAAGAGSVDNDSSDEESPVPGGPEDVFGRELVRIPASIEWAGRDSFQFKVPLPKAQTPQRPAWVNEAFGTPAPASGSKAGGRGRSSGGGTVLLLELDIPLAQLLSMHSDGSSSSSSTTATAEAAAPTAAAAAAPSAASLAADPAAAAAPAAGIPLTEAQKLLAKALVEAADRVARTQQPQSGRPLPRETLSKALRDVAQRLASGEVGRDGAGVRVDLVNDGAASLGNSRGPQQEAAQQAGKTQEEQAVAAVKYTRVPMDAPRTDPFSGVFIGAFGPHGPELLQLRRTTIDGEEAVVASKLTGDTNVPAGAVSFRVKVGRQHRLRGKDGGYPEELGVVARYRGEGRVAARGYSDPRWVDGELLVFAGASPLTYGAELGFVWAVPGEKRFLILLNKVDLAQCANK